MAELRTMPMTWAKDLFGRSDHPCAYCGKDVKRTGPRWFVHVIRGGAHVLHPDSEADYEEDAGEMGFHAVGPECRKHFGDFAVRFTAPS
jgi:hypothetical protein